MEKPHYIIKCSIGTFSTEKIRDLIENFSQCNFAIKLIPDLEDFYTFFMLYIDDFIELLVEDEQEKRFLTPKNLIIIINKKLKAGESFFLHGRYQDTELNIMFEKDSNFNVILTFTYKEWNKHVREIDDENSIDDNIRYAHLILRLLKPVAIKSFAILPREQEKEALPEYVESNGITVVLPSRKRVCDYLFYSLIKGAIYSNWFAKYTLSEDEALPPIDEIAEKIFSKEISTLYFMHNEFKVKITFDLEKGTLTLFPLTPYKLMDPYLKRGILKSIILPSNPKLLKKWGFFGQVIEQFCYVENIDLSFYLQLILDMFRDWTINYLSTSKNYLPKKYNAKPQEIINFEIALEALTDLTMIKIREGNFVNLPPLKLTASDTKIFIEGAKNLKAIPEAMSDDGFFKKVIKESLQLEPDADIINESIYIITKALELIKQGRKIDAIEYSPLKDQVLIDKYGLEKLKEWIQGCQENTISPLNTKIDLKVNNRLIDCKAINWYSVKLDIAILRFINRNELANNIGMKYEIYSKNKMPELLVYNLKRFDIPFYEDI